MKKDKKQSKLDP